MPYPTDADLSPHELVFRLETNNTVSPGPFGTMLREIERIARLKSHFGPDAEIELVDIGTGSIWTRIGIGIGVLGGLGGFGSFILALEDRLSRPSGTLAESLAQLALDDGVVEAKIVTHDKTIGISTNNHPAIGTVLHKRTLSQRDRPRMLEGGMYPRLPIAERPKMLLDEAAQIERDRSTEWAHSDLAADRDSPPKKKNGEFLFDASSDPRGASTFLGQFHRAGPDTFHFESERGIYYGAIFDPQIGVSADWLPTDQKMAVRATLDHANRSLYIFEFHKIDQL